MYSATSVGNYPTSSEETTAAPGITEGASQPIMDETEQASAPPLSSMEVIAGYENITFDSVPLPPPSYENSNLGQPSPERSDVASIPAMTEEQVRAALLDHVSEHCCYGSGPAKTMVIREVLMNSAFHYTLETFTEKRETAWAYEPYDGKHLDTAMNGPAPSPWDVLVSPSKHFVNEQIKLEIPHTAYAKMCHACIGNGRLRCSRCIGLGQMHCTWCNGSGHHHKTHDHQHHHDNVCNHCLGRGQQRCFRCNGLGQVVCRVCSGYGQLKCYVQMTVTWTNHLEDHISDVTKLPKELVREVSGHVAFEELQSRVWPITHFPDRAINEASLRLVNFHTSAFPMEKTIQQRHRVRIVPIAEVHGTWNDSFTTFFVYGFENKIYFPDYPQQCCCGCTLL